MDCKSVLQTKGPWQLSVRLYQNWTAEWNSCPILDSTSGQNGAPRYVPSPLQIGATSELTDSRAEPALPGVPLVPELREPVTKELGENVRLLAQAAEFMA
jgi:hypothetical protein